MRVEALRIAPNGILVHALGGLVVAAHRKDGGDVGLGEVTSELHRLRARGIRGLFARPLRRPARQRTKGAAKLARSDRSRSIMPAFAVYLPLMIAMMVERSPRGATWI